MAASLSPGRKDNLEKTKAKYRVKRGIKTCSGKFTYLHVILGKSKWQFHAIPKRWFGKGPLYQQNLVL